MWLRFFGFVSHVTAYELFGSLVSYEQGDIIHVHGSSLITFHGPKYSFYGNEMTCRPFDTSYATTDYLGDILAGSRLEPTPLLINMMEDKKCVPLCTPYHDAEDASKHYPGMHTVSDAVPLDSRKFPRLEVSIDKLVVPARGHLTDIPLHMHKFIATGKDDELYFHGVPLYSATSQLNNHWKITIEAEPTTSYRVEGGFLGIGGETKNVKKWSIVGIFIETESVSDITECEKNDDSPKAPYIKAQDRDSRNKNWFMSVNFVETPTKTWSERWNIVIGTQRFGITTKTGESAFKANLDDAKWYEAMIDSGVVAFTLVLAVGGIVCRIVHRDISAFAGDMESGDIDDEFTWKSLKGDVFRKPAHSTILVSLVGAGLQILFTSACVAGAQLLHLIPEFARGQLLQMALVSWCLCGFPASYLTCRLYNMFGSTNWKMTVTRTCLIVPFTSFIWFGFIYSCVGLMAKGGYAQTPYIVDIWGALRLLMFWCFFSLPLSALGCYLGLRANVIEFPTATAMIPTPQKDFSFNYLVLAITAGTLVHASSVAVVDSVIKNIFSDGFGYTSIMKVAFTSLEWLVVASLSTTCVTFFILSDGCPSWWWWGFGTPASCGLWITLLLLSEGSSRLHTAAELVVYVGVTGVVVSGFSLVAGAVGFLSSLAFMFLIYSKIRSD